MTIVNSSAANVSETSRTITFSALGQPTKYVEQNDCAMLDVRNVAKHYLVKTTCIGSNPSKPGFYE